MPGLTAPPIQPALPPVDERAAAGFARLSLQDAYWWETHRIDVDRLNIPPGPTDDEDYVALGAAWVRLIVARRAAAEAVKAVA